MTTCEQMADRFTVKIEEQECFLGLNERPIDVDLKLTITDDDGHVAVIVGMDEEFKRLVNTINEAMEAKKRRLDEADDEENEVAS